MAYTLLPAVCVTVTAVPALHVVALDLPGHGQSSHRPVGSLYHVQDYIADVKHVIDGKSKIKQIHILR